jgi:hypothetical protein
MKRPLMSVGFRLLNGNRDILLYVLEIIKFSAWLRVYLLMVSQQHDNTVKILLFLKIS